MQKYVKFLNKLPKRLRVKLILIIDKIAKNELKNLDVKPLVGKGNFYRVRFGKIRVVFGKNPDGNVIYDIGFRGNIYN